jgi:hypothetical protein
VRQFLDAVEATLPDDAALSIRGPGVIAERLARRIQNADAQKSRNRMVEVRHAARMTEPQMVAALRTFADDPPRRRHPPRGHRATRKRVGAPHFVPEVDLEE